MRGSKCLLRIKRIAIGEAQIPADAQTLSALQGEGKGALGEEKRNNYISK